MACAARGRGTRCQDHEGEVAFTVESLTRKVRLGRTFSHVFVKKNRLAPYLLRYGVDKWQFASQLVNVYS